VNQQNVYYGNILYDDTPFYIQTAQMQFQEIREDKSSKQKFMVVSVDPQDFTFYDLLVKLDDHNLASTYKYSKEWFQKELPMDVLETMYRRITKPFKKEDIPIIELRIPIQRQKYKCSLYDQNNESVSMDTLTKGVAITGILHINGLKFLKKDYYCDMYVSQIKICQNTSFPIFTECLIRDEHEEGPSVYDYEIMDEEVIHMNKEKLKLQEQVDKIVTKIEEDKKELLTLQQKISTLN